MNLYVHSLIFQYISCARQARSRELSIIFFNNYIPISISEVSTLWTEIQAYHLKRHVITCFKILSWNILNMFFRFYFIYIYLFLYLTIVHFIWRWECVGIQCKLIPEWIESNSARIRIWYISHPTMNQTWNKTRIIILTIA